MNRLDVFSGVCKVDGSVFAVSYRARIRFLSGVITTDVILQSSFSLELFVAVWAGKTSYLVVHHSVIFQVSSVEELFLADLE